jgi:metal-sulfur cluster biosynthetic enzyme
VHEAQPAAGGTSALEPGASIPTEEPEPLTADIVAVLKTVYDPEIPADIYELCLSPPDDLDDARNVAIRRRSPRPGCPVEGEMTR